MEYLTKVATVLGVVFSGLYIAGNILFGVGQTSSKIATKQEVSKQVDLVRKECDARFERLIKDGNISMKDLTIRLRLVEGTTARIDERTKQANRQIQNIDKKVDAILTKWKRRK